MKRRKKHLTAKALTLRLTAAALTMMLLACLLGFYTPFPSQVITQKEKDLSLGDTEVLQSQRLQTHRGYLVGNQNALTLLFCRYYPFWGWGSDGTATIDLSQESGPIWLEGSLYTDDEGLQDGNSCDFHFFGRVDCKDAVSIYIRFPVGSPAENLVLPLFQGKDGHLYFWGRYTIPWSEEATVDFFDVDADALDAHGNVLYTYETTPSYRSEELAGQ